MKNVGACMRKKVFLHKIINTTGVRDTKHDNSIHIAHYSVQVCLGNVYISATIYLHEPISKVVKDLYTHL